ncbi:LOW QUALITY PROTEIN: hypothetical protein IFM46972_06622 [Aspergillus udagawae]|uniref:Uncharacterized protein n=1 Tax=Aspergillus udagawae TaxID=91492 RepID=A0A8H3NY76_9EURO|nr:LOW QUALITY PROTEIN: hypothetical protein IFM46972_06622 [Aspergillus udagawae]
MKLFSKAWRRPWSHGLQFRLVEPIVNSPAHSHVWMVLLDQSKMKRFRSISTGIWLCVKIVANGIISLTGGVSSANGFACL